MSKPRRRKNRIAAGATSTHSHVTRSATLSSSSDPWVEKISRTCDFLARAEVRVPLATLARRFGGSPYHFQRNFKRIVGVSPREYAEACRLQKVRQRLREGERVTNAVFDAGYG